MTEKQLPTKDEPVTRPPFLMGSAGAEVTKASEKVEMQRVTADVYAMHQRAIQYGRDEARCYQTLIDLCGNVEFASILFYAVKRGFDKVDGIGIDGANEIARVWGHIDSGCVSHGVYNNEAQMEAYATDLVAPRRRSSRFTLNVADMKNAPDRMKGEASKEERNCILDVVPAWVKSGMIKAAKRTLLAAVQDVPKAFESCVAAFKKDFELDEDSLWAFIAKKPVLNDKHGKVTAADIVDLRTLYKDAKADDSVLDEFFPNRKKSSKPGVATENPKQKAKAASESSQPKESASSVKQSDSPDPKPSSSSTTDSSDTSNGEPNNPPAAESAESSQDADTAPAANQQGDPF